MLAGMQAERIEFEEFGVEHGRLRNRDALGFPRAGKPVKRPGTRDTMLRIVRNFSIAIAAGRSYFLRMIINCTSRRKLQPMRQILPLLAGAIALAASAAAAAKDVNIYSYRQAVLMKPLLDRFEQRTGIEAHVVYLKKGMIARLKAEGAASPADVILTVDAARLIRLDRMGAFQPLDSAAVNAAVPANLRHTKGHWFGLTVRAPAYLLQPR